MSTAQDGVAWPPGHRLPGRGLPLAFVLPGRGRGPREMLQGGLRLGDFAAGPVVQGDALPFALVAVDGGDTYWHRPAGTTTTTGAASRQPR